MLSLQVIFELLCQEDDFIEPTCTLAGLISNIPSDYIEKSIEFIRKFDVNDSNLLKV